MPTPSCPRRFPRGAAYWEWHEFGFGVAFEACFGDDAAAEAFRTLPVVGAALELAPDPVNGVVMYRGRGGGSGARVPRRPRPFAGAGAIALPEPLPSEVPVGPTWPDSTSPDSTSRRPGSAIGIGTAG